MVGSVWIVVLIAVAVFTFRETGKLWKNDNNEKMD